MTARTFLPKSSSMPWKGEHRPLYRWYQESRWTLVPGGLSYPTSRQAVAAADEYLAKGLNPPIRAEQAPQPPPDILNISRFHEERIARQIQSQEEALGGIVVGRRVVKVERKGVRV